LEKQNETQAYSKLTLDISKLLLLSIVVDAIEIRKVEPDAKFTIAKKTNRRKN
jgi:hypothetical protein